ncbi:MAG: hypothetical protein GXP55_13160 [Deltaproteobacteria bacterium]|nr:hypothetical protein [Deltaproteobacteria bacterium]
MAPSMSPPPAPAATATRLRRGAIGGTYDRASAQAHVRDAEAAANRCVARARPATGSAQYRVEVPPDGNVMRVTGGDAAVRRCLARAFRMIRWSPPPCGASQYLTLTYEAIP